MKPILFTLIHKNEEYQVQTARDQYHSLMTLIADYLAIPGFGLCGGMGSCGTCLVEIREKGAMMGRTVLACDVPVDDALANTCVMVSDEYY